MPIDDCAICSQLLGARQALKMVSFYIGLSPSKKHDFGLYLNAVKAEESQIARLISYHEAYHNGSSTIDNSKTTKKSQFQKKGRQKK